MHGGRAGSACFDEYRPVVTPSSTSNASTADLCKRTDFSSPKISTGSIFILSATASCALAPAPAAVMLFLYATRMSTIFWKSASRASSSLCDRLRSTALFASSVAIATWSADAKISDMFVVVGYAEVTTRIRRSPARCKPPSNKRPWSLWSIGAYRSRSCAGQRSASPRTVR